MAGNVEVRYANMVVPNKDVAKAEVVFSRALRAVAPQTKRITILKGVAISRV